MKNKEIFNYGLFFESFSEYLTKQYSNTKKNRKIMKEFIDIINNNELLKETHSLYNFVEGCKNTNLFTRIMNESDKYLKEQTLSNIKKSENLLKEFMNKYDIQINLECEKSNLYEAINTLLKPTNKPSYNIKRQKAINLIENYINNEQNNCNFEKKDVDVDKKIASFDEIYLDLTDEEKEILESTLQENDVEKRKLLFDKTKKECLDKINEEIKNNNDINIKEKLLNAKEMLLDMEFEESTFVEKILKLYEFKN